MPATHTFGDVSVTIDKSYVAEIEIHRPPNNHFDAALVRDLGDAYEAMDRDPDCRAIVLCSEGRHFCAGANFASPTPTTDAAASGGGNELYREAARLIDARTPVVAAVHGAAIGGGLGLACSADFRVGCSETRVAANFSQLGLHHGFGLTVLLPAIVGQQRALELLLTGRRLSGEAARDIGLLDRFVEPAEVRAEAHRLAAEIASAAPLAVTSIRETMRLGLTERYRLATDREGQEQDKHRPTADFKEGVRAYAERRSPVFTGH